MELNRERGRELLLLAGICGFLFFYQLGGFGLIGADEPRYAQVAREMLERHDWVTPILNHGPWLEKPILYYWGAMLSYSVFGVSDWAARVPSAVLATLMVFAVYWFASRFRPAMRLDMALMTASGAMVFGMAHAAATDMPLTVPFTVSLLAWFAWYCTRRRVLLVAFYAANALAMLAKGPVAPVLAAGIIILFALALRRPKLILESLWLPGVIVFCAVALPWYVLVQLHTPQFARVFLLEHNLARFGTNMFRHKQPFWFYMPVALAATLPWIAFTVSGVIGAVRDLKFQKWKPEEGDEALGTFLLIWALVPIAFFSISTSKLPAYILPAVPALLLLGAEWVHGRIRYGVKPGALLAFSHAAVLALFAAVTVMSPTWLLKQPASVMTLMAASTAGTVVFLVVALGLYFRGWELVRFLTLAVLIVCVGYVLRTQIMTVDAVQSARPVNQLIRELGVPDTETVAVFGVKRDLEYGMQFYRNLHVCTYQTIEQGQPETVAIPEGAHLVVIREGRRAQLAAALGGRAVAFAGYYRPQHLELYSVAAR